MVIVELGGEPSFVCTHEDAYAVLLEWLRDAYPAWLDVFTEAAELDPLPEVS